MPRFTERAPTDPAGLKDNLDLPYNLRPQDILRMVEDVHELLHEVNSVIVERGFDRLEELLDRAGFSGFISRSVVARLDKLTRALVQNCYHNGYPDLLPRGAYPGDSVQHGTKGGLEVKASRNQSSWESHGPRDGWFCVVQFKLDEDPEKALQDREPTQILAVMVTKLLSDDWSWQPAKTGRIRSGTASIKPSGASKLRSSAAWVDPNYQVDHEDLLLTARRNAWRVSSAREDCLQALTAARVPVSAKEVAESVADRTQLPADKILSTVRTVLKKFVDEGIAATPVRGRYKSI